MTNEGWYAHKETRLNIVKLFCAEFSLKIAISNQTVQKRIIIIIWKKVNVLYLVTISMFLELF